jgi:hypothetical protein
LSGDHLHHVKTCERLLRDEAEHVTAMAMIPVARVLMRSPLATVIGEQTTLS